MRMRHSIVAREKGVNDLVTEADTAAQAAIKQVVLGAYADHHFVGEEDDPDATRAEAAEFTWIVDPLDGTTNYVHGLENFCVSVALQRRTELIVGCVYDPVRDFCYSASRGNGATRNGEKLCVSRVTRVRDALVAASLPPVVAPDSAEVERFLKTMFGCQALRRLGSAALNLCYVAGGQLDAYWATSVKKWDIAAGFVIVSEAGGTIEPLEGGAIDLDRPSFVASGQADLNQELITLLR